MLPSIILNSSSEEIACLYQENRGLVGAPFFLQYCILKSGRVASTRKDEEIESIIRQNNKPYSKCRDLLFEAWIWKF